MSLRHRRPANALAPPFNPPKLPDPEELRRSSASIFRDLNDPEVETRVGAIRRLALICASSLTEPDSVSQNLLSLFEYYAKYSPHGEMRIACIDAIGLSWDIKRLGSLSFELGSHETSVYRDRAVRDLKNQMDRPD